MHHILVLRPGALGDTILTIPALAALRRAFPSARITFAGHPGIGPLLAGHYVDHALAFDNPDLAPLFDSTGQERAALPPWLRETTLAVIWMRQHAALVERLENLGAKTIAAPSCPPPGQHAADYLLSTLAPLVGPVALPATPLLTLRAEDAAFGRHFMPPCTRPVAAIHPGSGGRRKCWPAEWFARVAERLRARGLEVLLVAGPADDEPVEDFLAALSGARPLLAKDLAVAQLAAVLARCAIYIGNDSGVSHLAAAVDAPAVAIYGPTDPQTWGIRGRRVAWVRGRTLDEITVDEVFRTVERML